VFIDVNIYRSCWVSIIAMLLTICRVLQTCVLSYTARHQYNRLYIQGFTRGLFQFTFCFLGSILEVPYVYRFRGEGLVRELKCLQAEESAFFCWKSLSQLSAFNLTIWGTFGKLWNNLKRGGACDLAPRSAVHASPVTFVLVVSNNRSLNISAIERDAADRCYRLIQLVASASAACPSASSSLKHV